MVQSIWALRDADITLQNSPKRRRLVALPPHADVLTKTHRPQMPWGRIVALQALCLPPFQNHYTHKIIICKLFRSLQLQLSGPLNRLNAILSLLQPLDRYRTPSAIGSAIGRPLPLLSNGRQRAGAF